MDHKSFNPATMRAVVDLEGPDDDFTPAKGYTVVGRLIVGDGVAGTALFAHLNKDYRNGVTENGPNVLVIHDPSNQHQWIKQGRGLMGQGTNVNIKGMSIPANTTRNEIKPLDSDADPSPYGYTRGDSFTKALEKYQEKMDMQSIPAKIIRFEKRRDGMSWPTEANACQYRAVLEKLPYENDHRYIYAEHFDLCAGLGDPRKLTKDQIDPALASELEKERKIIYGQNEVDPQLEGTVVIYGGGAIGAEIAANQVHRKSARDVFWVAREPNEFNPDGKNQAFKAVVTQQDAVQFLRCGDLQKVEKLETGKIKITFNASAKKDNYEADNFEKMKNNTEIVCDHLILTMGQVGHPLIKSLQTDLQVDFNPIYGRVPDTTQNYALGTQSKDGVFTTWGAIGRTGAGLSNKDWDAFNRTLNEQLKTVPLESRGAATILCSLHAISSQARAFQLNGTLNGTSPDNFYRNINIQTPEQIFAEIKTILDSQTFAHNGVEIDISKLVDAILNHRTDNDAGFTQETFEAFLNQYTPILTDSVKEKISVYYFGLANKPYAELLPKDKAQEEAPGIGEGSKKRSISPTHAAELDAERPAKKPLLFSKSPGLTLPPMIPILSLDTPPAPFSDLRPSK